MKQWKLKGMGERPTDLLYSETNSTIRRNTIHDYPFISDNTFSAMPPILTNDFDPIITICIRHQHKT